MVGLQQFSLGCVLLGFGGAAILAALPIVQAGCLHHKNSFN
jgi:hypothetical protein